MLSHEVWQRRYHGDPALVGRSVTVNGTPHTVVGVMPPRFSFPENAEDLDSARTGRRNRQTRPRAICSRSAG